MRKSTIAKCLLVLIAIALINLLFSCGPSREEYLRQQQIDGKKTETAEVHEIETNTNMSIRVIVVDKCEYICYNGSSIIHKKNCRNCLLNHLGN